MSHSDGVSSDIRYGVLGTGRITRRIVPDIQSTSGSMVTAIASRDGERARWFADTYAVANPVTGYEALLSRDDVDAVYVALPPSLHYEWTLAAAEAGKHVLCEKPMAMNASEVAEMIQTCRQHNVCLLDATAWLHHDRTQQFRHWLTTTGPALASPKPNSPFDDGNEDDGLPFRLGGLRHLSASVSFRSPFQSGDHRLDPTLGGGCLLDLGWYAAGVITMVTEQTPRRLAADVIHSDGVVVRVSATMRFDHDITATLSCGFDTATRKWCEIAGEDASIVCDDFTRPWPERPARSWIHEASGKVHSMLEPGASGEPLRLCHQERQMIANFGEMVRDRDDARQDMRALQTQALRTQQTLDLIAKQG